MNRQAPHTPGEACVTCPSRLGTLRRLGLQIGESDHVVALAGNPNTGKTTVFNALTGLRMHTGNWPGKTISRAEGGFTYDDKRYRIVDLPGTYSLLSASPDEEVARSFLLFGRPDVTVIVIDATCIERNLNLALQILQITRRAVVCLNLMDEARAHGMSVDVRQLARDLGVPVVPCAARSGEGIPELLAELSRVATSAGQPAPRKLPLEIAGLRQALDEVESRLADVFPQLAQPRWVALRLLEGDREIIDAVRDGAIGSAGDAADPADNDSARAHPAPLHTADASTSSRDDLLRRAGELRWQLPPDLHDRIAESIHGEAARIAARAVTRGDHSRRLAWQQKLDRLLTHPWTAFPIMVLVLGVILWLTIVGANVPSAMLASLLVDQGHTLLSGWAEALGAPAWLKGLVVDGMYLATAWVVSVMLPPMAIFFPCFTLLEDFGFLPRVAFNLDRLFQKVGAHGKQALTMAMGLGCNAAGVVATRIIDSPRERLIAILTNNFSLCNGRWPTQILMAGVFIGTLAPEAWRGSIAALSVLAVALLGFGFAMLTSWLLARTVLRGEATSFSLELPPYRPPAFWRTLATSLVDRTLIVLWRAVVFALPAGAAIWLCANVQVADRSLAAWFVEAADPLAWTMGLTGVVLLAYIVAIPANEIVVPTILMLTVLVAGLDGGAGTGVMFETDPASVRAILEAGGWTTLTAVCLMLFSLCHNPCSTTLYTIHRETGSWKWTTVAALLPLAVGFLLCSLVASVWRALA
ncbi:MAG: ferrous iron transport protein B [Verrucomicrobia bacterium]|nr:ferrous iron transport protein B [Verrucomicrobiota bacterium]